MSPLSHQFASLVLLTEENCRVSVYNDKNSYIFRIGPTYLRKRGAYERLFCIFSLRVNERQGQIIFSLKFILMIFIFIFKNKYLSLLFREHLWCIRA